MRVFGKKVENFGAPVIAAGLNALTSMSDRNSQAVSAFEEKIARFKA